jgi:hypothetical protein
MIKIYIRNIIAVIFIVLTAQLSAGELNLPDQLDEKWIALKPVRHFNGEELYSHINGGAELFLEFGFENLSVCKYSDDKVSFDLEIYKMENFISALGIYLNKTGAESPIKEIPARNTANLYQIVITSGRYFIMVNNFSGDKDVYSSMISLSQQIVNQIDTEDDKDVFDLLPTQNIIEDSKIIFRGPFGLQSVYTFGKGDVLLLGGKIFGVGASYDLGLEKHITRLVIPYPDQIEAQNAFENLISNLDSYHEIVKKFDNHFVFKDFNQEYGSVKIIKSQIHIELHRDQIPE